MIFLWMTETAEMLCRLMLHWQGWGALLCCYFYFFSFSACKVLLFKQTFLDLLDLVLHCIVCSFNKTPLFLVNWIAFLLIMKLLITYLPKYKAFFFLSINEPWILLVCYFILYWMQGLLCWWHCLWPNFACITCRTKINLDQLEKQLFSTSFDLLGLYFLM